MVLQKLLRILGVLLSRLRQWHLFKGIVKLDIKKLAKLLVRKKWDVAGELLSQFSRPLRVSFREADLATSAHGIQWVISTSDSCEFIFSKSMPQHEFQPCITRLILLMPMLKAFHCSKYFQSGSLFINLGDWADTNGLALCSNRDDSTLIPGIDFLSTNGYRETRLDFMVNSPPWNMRKPIAFWRGNTTGVRVGDSWRSLPRVQLCELANQTNSQPFFDVGITSFAQLSKREAREIRAAGYVRSFAPITSCSRFKYQIDIDGNSNAWSALFQKLLSGSVVLKVASPGNFRQWYYDQLIPWKNFVPVRSDMSDLVEKIQWLLTHDDEAREIGINGAKLAYQLTYEQELDRALVNINKALT